MLTMIQLIFYLLLFNILNQPKTGEVGLVIGCVNHRPSESIKHVHVDTLAFSFTKIRRYQSVLLHQTTFFPLQLWVNKMKRQLEHFSFY